MTDNTLAVILDSAEFGSPQTLGSVRQISARGPISFEFDPEWLGAQHQITLDPELGSYAGPQYPASATLFGILSDIAPDRWGRMLLQRREAAVARREGRKPRALDEWDYLTQVSDESRMGALRLARIPSGEFVGSSQPPVPPRTRLQQLQVLAHRAEEGETLTTCDEEAEVALLIAPGSSLGGARPKASFRDRDGALWIAKFPSSSDTWNVGGWEGLLNSLARKAGLTVPDTQLLTLAGPHQTFLAQRFDRVIDRRRLFASAMTLAERQDHDRSASYLHIAEAITLYGDPGHIGDDLRELFVRMVFNVMVGHRDDHLRNHGFIGTPRGWRLAPCFDLNPVPNLTEHALALDVSDHTPDLDVVVSIGRYFRLTPVAATEIVAGVSSAVSTWQNDAVAAGLPRDEIDLMSNAFTTL